MCLLPDLKDKIPLKKGLEVLRVLLPGLRKHVLVHEFLDRAALHRYCVALKCNRWLVLGDAE